MAISPTGAGAAPAVGPGRSLDLKVLVISVGDRTADSGLELMARTLEQFGVPYDVLDSTTTTLTDAMLATGLRGHYNGIILTQADLFTPSGSGFTLEEWQRLHAYERDFGVRESVIAGFPALDPGHDLDYGMGSVGVQVTGTGRWVAPAGTGRTFTYVNTTHTIDIPEFSFWGVPRNDGSGPQVTPLLVDDAAPTHALVSKLVYADGREVLLSTVGNAWYRLHSNVLAYQFIDFATKGLFIGGRYVSLSTHTDDMFLADDLWDPATKSTNFNNSYRMTPADLDNVVAQQAAFRTAHPLASGWKVQFPFNGIGAKGWTPNPRVTRTVGSDSRLIKATSANYGRATGIVVSKSGTAESRALFRADGSIAAPVADRLDKVVLRVNVTAASGPLAVDVCPVTQVWVEGAGNGGLLDIFDVSWNTRQTLQGWQTAGGTHATAECLHKQITGVGFNELDITPIWQTWANGSRFNSGVLVKPTGTGSVTIASSESTTTANRPTLGFDTSTKPEPLTGKVLDTMGNFGWINHTYAALQMDRLCPDPDEPQPDVCPVTDYATARGDIDQNRTVWTQLGLPGYQEGLSYLLSDSHAGLHDRQGTEEDPSDDIPFPQGANPNFLQAAQDLGVQYVASDSSRPNQDKEQRVPGFNLVLLPRFPTNIYVNATTPAENIDEYNWLYHDRFVAMGQDPCTIPGAICATKTYEQMLDAEADTTVSHMLSGKAWPHYFHQSNLRDYGAGRTLQIDWMNAVMTRYEQIFTLPVRTPTAPELGPDALDRIVSREQNVRGWVDLDTGQVTLQANGTAHPLVTGLTGGEVYGGQTIGKVTVGTSPQTFAVDPSAAG
ncbi:MAG TPA: DNRLRE domain-containing protein [Acidimicrobiales bacterium]|nr:DNRLRE domain-containing protein [Acidimicrobiales bacterium]